MRGTHILKLYAVAVKKLDSIIGHVPHGKQSFIEGLLYSDLVLIFLKYLYMVESSFRKLIFTNTTSHTFLSIDVLQLSALNGFNYNMNSNNL